MAWLGSGGVTTIVHTADLHLDSPLRDLPADAAGNLPADFIRTATRRAAYRVVEVVIRERADVLIVAGDVWDRDHVGSTTVEFFAEQMGILHDHGVPVFVVDGNHDACHPERGRWRLPPNVQWYGPGPADMRILGDLGLAVHGRGQPTAHVTADLSVGYPAPVPGMVNVGMLHTSLDHSYGGALCAPTTVRALAARGYQYWALGHVHRRTVVSTDPWIVYPGNPQGRSPMESGRKSVTLIETDGAAVTTVREVDVTLFAY